MRTNQRETRALPKGRGNHSNSEKRSRDGRKGRGQDAFTAKIKDDEDMLQTRMDEIVRKARQLETGGIFHLESIPLPVGGCRIG